MEMEFIPVETQGLLLELLQQTFGSKTKIAGCQIGNQHEDYLVLLLSLRQPSIKVVVKLAGPKAVYPSPFERVASLNKLVATNTSIPMPQILAVDVSYRKWPWRYLIKTTIPGQEWMKVRPQLNDKELAKAYQQLGKAVAELHSLKFPDFGELNEDGKVQPELNFITALANRARLNIKSKALCELFLSFLESKADLFSGVQGACLCHEDLHGHNVLFEKVEGQWQFATILDFDKTWAGHQEIDLARMQFWDGMSGEGFWSAYNTFFSLDDLYAARRPIYQLLWCMEYAAPTPRHLADIQELCRLLGLPPIKQFDPANAFN